MSLSNSLSLLQTPYPFFKLPSNYPVFPPFPPAIISSFWKSVSLSPERKEKTTWYHLYTESKTWYKWTYLQNRKRLREWIYSCQGRGIVGELEMDIYTLLCLKRVTNKDLLYITWNSAQCCVAAWMGGELGEEWIHVPLLLTWNYHNIVC